jgi:hypothetical protein
MSARNYSNTATVPALSGTVTALTTALAVTSNSGWPAAPCHATIEIGTANAEVVLITNVAPLTFTAIRGQGGTAAIPHTAGATVTLTAVAADYAEANAHVNATSGVHGVAGFVVDTTTGQTLTNKTLTSPILNTVTGNASASAPGQLIKAAASGGQDIVQWATSAGAVLSRVTNLGSVQAPTAVLTNTVAASMPLVVKGAASQTGKLVSAQNSSGTEQFAVDKLGKVLINPVSDEGTALLRVKLPAAGLSANAYTLEDSAGTILWRIGALGDMTVTGLSLNTNGGFDRFNTVDTKFRIDSGANLVMSGAKVTLDATQANNVATTPNKLGKRMHWGRVGVTTDGSGYANVTHGAGFTPSVVIAQWSGESLAGGLGPVTGADTYGATTFRVRASISSTLTVAYVCYE